MSKYITRKYHNRVVAKLKGDIRAECRQYDNAVYKINRLEKELEEANNAAERHSRTNRDLESKLDEVQREVRKISDDMGQYAREDLPTGCNLVNIERQYGRIEASLSAFLEKYFPSYGRMRF